MITSFHYNSDIKSFSIDDIGDSPSIRAHMREGAKLGAGAGTSIGAGAGALGVGAVTGGVGGVPGAIAGGMVGGAVGTATGAVGGMAVGTYRKAKHFMNRVAPIKKVERKPEGQSPIQQSNINKE